MGEEIGFVQQSMNAFSQQIIDSGIDVHAILLASEQTGMPALPLMVDGVCLDAPLGSGSCPADSNPPNYAHINQPVGSWDVLDVYINAYPSYKAHLRENALKTFVTISDDNADSLSLRRSSTAPTNSSRRCKRSSRATRCGRAGATPASTASACAKPRSQWARSMRTWWSALRVSAEICACRTSGRCSMISHGRSRGRHAGLRLDIPPSPAGATFDAAKSNVQLTLDGNVEQLLKAPSAAECGAREGWHYDDEDAPQKVVACPSTCARIQAATEAKVDLLFGCETVVIPVE